MTTEPDVSDTNPVQIVEAEIILRDIQTALRTALDVVAMSQRLARELGQNSAALVQFDRGGHLSKVDMRTLPPAASPPTTADTGATK